MINVSGYPGMKDLFWLDQLHFPSSLLGGVGFVSVQECFSFPGNYLLV
jgi:hypothetical protein